MKHVFHFFPYGAIALLCMAAGCGGGGGGRTAVDSMRIPYREVTLSDTSAFRYSDPRHHNWSVASAVYSDRRVVHSLETTPGTGILVSRPTDSDRAELLTKFVHGDIDLELDFMMPKGSNSGIYLMGRYEVQLFDSWLKPRDSLRYGDCGGIYERMAGGRGYEGHAPALNASKAPGLWQHLKIRFHAPRFDAQGRKIANARFEYVYLNGALVQHDVEASLPTLGSYFSDEEPEGPLEIQGSHGPVAIRHIRYRTYINGRIRLSSMELKVYKSLYKNIDTLAFLTPEQVLHPDSLSQRSYDKYEQGDYRGTMEVPATGDYIFKLQAGGPSWLWIDSSLVVSNHLSGDYFTPWYGRVHLAGGAHHFRLIYNNRYQQFKLSYEGSQVPETVLTTESSAFPEPVPEPYPITVGHTAVVQRCFFQHEGVKETHAITVGFPGGINYAYDLRGYDLLSVWRGGFLDAADMWRERGEQQLGKPLGGLTELAAAPALETPGGPGDPWMDSIPVDSGVYAGRYYRLLKGGSPVFGYTFKGVEVRDYLHPDTANGALVRELSFRFPDSVSGEKFDFLVAAGGTVKRLPRGDYSADDASYYITGLRVSGGEPEIVQDKGRDELRCAVIPQGGKAFIRYEIIW